MDIKHYFGRGYYHLYRHYLLPREQTRAEAEFLVKRLRPRRGERWLDLPCGYGRHLAELHALRPDLHLSGGDINFDYLREPGASQSARLTACDMRRLPFANGSFDTVINLLNSFGYYPPQMRNAKCGMRNEEGIQNIPHSAFRIPHLDDRAVLAEMARVLRPGGRLVLDLANRRALIALVRRQPAFRYSGGEYEVLERFAWDAREQVLRNETVWRWPGGRERARYRLRLYTPAQIRAMLGRAGFEVTGILGGFEDAPLGRESDRMLVIAKRG